MGWITINTKIRFIILFTCVIFCISVEGINAQSLARQNKDDLEDLIKLPIDIQLIPEYEQIDQEMQFEDEQVKVSKVFENLKPISQQLDSFFMNINSITIYDRQIKSIHQPASPSNQGIIMLHLSITNTGSYDMEINTQEFHLLNQGQTRFIRPNVQSFPMESGELSQVLQQSNNVLKPEQTVEGYLIFNLSSQEYQSLNKIGYFNFNYQPMKNEALGNDELLEQLYLPANQAFVDQLIPNYKFNHDILTTLWLGQKTLVAEKDYNKVLTQTQLDLNVKRIELVSLEPRKYYKQFFQMDQNPLFYSISYELVNHQSKSIFIDSDEINSILNIGHFSLQQEAFFKRKRGLLELRPEDKITMVEIYRVDENFYQSYLQETPVKFNIDIPVLVSHPEGKIQKKHVKFHDSIELSLRMLLNSKLKWEIIE